MALHPPPSDHPLVADRKEVPAANLVVAPIRVADVMVVPVLGFALQVLFLAEPNLVEVLKVVWVSTAVTSLATSNRVAETLVVQAASPNRFRLPASTDQWTRPLGFVSALAASSPASQVVGAMVRLDKKPPTLQSLLAALRGSRRRPQHWLPALPCAAWSGGYGQFP